MKKIITIGILLLLLINFSSCSSDDDSQQSCLETSIIININGDVQSFQATGRALNLRENGHELTLSLSRHVSEPHQEQFITIKLPFNKTGENSINYFVYRQNIEGSRIEGDFTDHDFQSNVITNTNECFYATFSGKLNNDHQEVTINEGEVIFKYEEPF